MTPASALWVIAMGIATLATAAWIVAVVDCTFRRYSRTREKAIWLLVTVLGHCLGAVIYWFVGRERGTFNSM